MNEEIKARIEEMQKNIEVEKDKTIEHQSKLIDQLQELLKGKISAEEQVKVDDSIDINFKAGMTKIVAESKTYQGRKVIISELNNKSIRIQQYSDHIAKTDPKYATTELNFSPETFILMLESFNYAAKLFKINKEEILEILTEGKEKKEIEFITTMLVEMV
jgi:hypothetical protein